MALFHGHFFSEVLGVSFSVDVILPQPSGAALAARSRRRKPLQSLYLLHGLSDDHTIWQRRTSIERYAAAYDLAVIMPAVQRSFYVDMAYGYRFWTHLAEELPALVRAFFPVSAARRDTFAAGLSMGGYGAFKLALARPEQYAAAASLSGALDVARLAEEPARGTEMRLIFGDQPARVRGGEHDLFRLAARVARSKGPVPRLYACCGQQDHLIEDNRRFRARALKLGLELTYEEHPGTHEWGYWDRQIQRVLEWLPLRRAGA